MCTNVCIRVHECTSSRVSERAGPLVPGPVRFWSPRASPPHSLSAGPRRRRQSGRDLPCAFVFRPRSAPAAARLLESCWASPKSPERSVVLPGAGRVGGGPSRELTPAGRGDPWPSRLCPQWPRPGGRCRRCSCDLPLVCIRRGRPGTRGAFPAARPGLERRGPARSGAEPWAEGALTLARQVGGGGAGSASGRWAGRVGAL